MRATSKLLAIALVALAQPAFAALEPVVVDFEKITPALDPDEVGIVSLASINPYAELGVNFTGGAWGVVSAASGCGGVSLFVPADSGCAALLLANNAKPKAQNPTSVPVAAATLPTTLTINFAAGFITGSSLAYKALPGAGVVIELFAEEDGVGSIAKLTGLDEGNCGSSANFCDWGKPLQLNFGGIAKSMVISGVDESFMVDNLSFLRNEATVPGQLPEPASLALALSALGVLGWSRKRAGAR
jgi:hypothetical protein